MCVIFLLISMYIDFMKITKTSIGVAAAMALSFGVALAEKPVSLSTDIGVSTSTGLKVEGDSINTNTDVSEKDTTNSATDFEKNKANTENNSEEGQKNSKENEHTNVAGDHADTTMSASHRSVVALFVQNLLKIADRKGDIGAQVRVVAQAQSDENDTTTTAIAHVEGRGGFKTFLIGSDYKNLGALRSEMVKTNTQIDQLRALSAKTTNTTDKVALDAQIKVLVAEQAKLQAFVTAHENKFSLFGWAVKKN
jgi:hypothetical protein